MMQTIQAYAAKAPGGANRYAQAAGQLVDEFGKTIENQASNLGSSRTIQQAGEALQRDGQIWLQNFKDQSKDAWNNFRMYMPESQPVPVANYDATLQQVRQDLAEAAKHADVLQPTLAKNLRTALDADVSPNGTMSWKAVQGIRSRLGEMLGDTNVVANSDINEIKRLYGALSDDMGLAVAATNNPKAISAYQNATQVTRDGHTFIENGLAQILKKGQTPEGAAVFALGGASNGGTRLAAIKSEMPGATDELAAYKLRDMAAANPGQQNADSTAISPVTFGTSWSRDLSPEAKAALYAEPSIRSKLDALAVVAESARGTAAKLNHSNTGAFMQAGHALASPMAAIEGARSGFEAAGMPGAIGGALAGGVAPFVPGYIAGRMTTSPAITRFMATPAPSGGAMAAPIGLGAAYPAISPAVRGLLDALTAPTNR
jgi:hypothetical protein